MAKEKIEDIANKSACEVAEDYGLDIWAIPRPEDGSKITAKDVEKYAKELKKGEVDAQKEASNPVEKEEAPKKKGKKALICAFDIKENGLRIPAGSVYEGKNAKYLLKRKAIREECI